MTVEQLVTDLERCRFYGSVELKFEAGRLVVIKKTETIKPNNCRDNRGADEHFTEL